MNIFIGYLTFKVGWLFLLKNNSRIRLFVEMLFKRDYDDLRKHLGKLKSEDIDFMKKKIILLLGAILCLGVVSSFNVQPAQASFATKHHLKAYVVPKRFRGTWHHKKEKIKITKRTVDGKLLYKFPKHRVIPYSSKIYLVQKDGKGIVLSVPQADGFSLKRSGKSLIWYAFGTKVKYHR